MLRLVFGFLICLVSNQALANFSITGKLELKFADGQQQQQNYPLQLMREQGSYIFQAGQQQTRLNTPLQRYTIAVILQNEQDVWVTEFANQPLHGFTFDIAGHTLSLSKDPTAKTAPGQFVLRFNDEMFYFSRGPGQINFTFDDQGVAEIQIKGMFKPRR